MFAVPAATPATLPEASTVAIVASLLAQEPPVVVFAKTVEPPWQTEAAPVIDVGVAVSGFTVIVVVAVALPQLVVTV